MVRAVVLQVAPDMRSNAVQQVVQYDRRYRGQCSCRRSQPHNQGLALRLQEAASVVLSTLPGSKSPHRDVHLHSTERHRWNALSALPPVQARGSRYDSVCQAQAFVQKPPRRIGGVAGPCNSEPMRQKSVRVDHPPAYQERTLPCGRVSATYPLQSGCRKNT